MKKRTTKKSKIENIVDWIFAYIILFSIPAVLLGVPIYTLHNFHHMMGKLSQVCCYVCMCYGFSGLLIVSCDLYDRIRSGKWN